MDIEFRARSWEMWLEGTSDNKPSENDIVDYALKHRYKIKGLEVWFDNMQKFWRFNADIISF